jgi:hypothetical protein
MKKINYLKTLPVSFAAVVPFIILKDVAVARGWLPSMRYYLVFFLFGVAISAALHDLVRRGRLPWFERN